MKITCYDVSVAFLTHIQNTFTPWKNWKGCVNKWDGNDPNFLPTIRRSCITTMHLLIRQCLFLATKQIAVLEHPAYSPDPAPNDFFSVPDDEGILKGRHFDDTDDIRSNTTAALKDIPQIQFQIVLNRRWHRCIASEGEYFEGDHGGIQL